MCLNTMATLYVIGNGFDLAHKLPTKYDPDLFNELYKLDSDVANAISELYFQNTVQYWQYFESLIGSTNEYLIDILRGNIENNIQGFQDAKDADIDYFSPEDERYGDDYSAVDNAIHSASLTHIEVENALESTPLLQIDKIQEALDEGFKNMISEANEINTQYPKKLQLFDRFDKTDDRFITFNYTNTLEKVYGIYEKNILHIHGDLDSPVWGNQDINISELQEDFFHDLDYNNHQNDFDLDHAKPDEIAAYNASSDEEGVSPFYLSNYDDYVNELNEPNTLLDGIVLDLNTLNSSMTKVLNLGELEQWIDSNIEENRIETVEVIGHSLGTVDMPYFNLLADKFNNKKWIVCFHGRKDPVFQNALALNGSFSSDNQIFFHSL